MAHADAERDIRDACESGDYDAALTHLLDAYGRELFSFLCARMHGVDDAGEVFSAATERMWKGLPGFAWRSSARGWAYAICRNAMNSFHARAHRRPDRNLRLSGVGEVSALVERLRTETALHLKTTTKDRMRALRESLPGDDQTLLILRVDRGLSWSELAQVMSDAPLDDDALKRAAARLRQRFQGVKLRLKALAKAEGLL